MNQDECVFTEYIFDTGVKDDGVKTEPVMMSRINSPHMNFRLGGMTKDPCRLPQHAKNPGRDPANMPGMDDS